jgi:SAM-dependent methyltransferase
MTDGYVYPGGELELFQGAIHWKRYWSSQIKRFVGGRVAEVGAGIGANTVFLYEFSENWVCVEPDPALAREIAVRKASGDLDQRCVVEATTLRQLPKTASFNTILYIDVLEHIGDDRDELREAALRLRPNGYLVVLGPAHNWLFTPFDAAIGHFRRYTRRSLVDLAPPGLSLRSVKYLDAVGMLASLANRCLLRSAHPSAAQISLWDNVMIPASKLADRATGYRIGKSIIGVWQAR